MDNKNAISYVANSFLIAKSFILNTSMDAGDTVFLYDHLNLL